MIVMETEVPSHPVNYHRLFRYCKYRCHQQKRDVSFLIALYRFVVKVLLYDFPSNEATCRRFRILLVKNISSAARICSSVIAASDILNPRAGSFSTRFLRMMPATQPSSIDGVIICWSLTIKIL